MEAQLAPLFAGVGRSEVVLVALAAGAAEEALFRGVLQTALDARLPAALAIGIAGLLFGAAHWVSTSYAVLAAVVGVYLGTLFHLTGNLLAPVTAHALYDVVALSILARVKPASTGSVV